MRFHRRTEHGIGAPVTCPYCDRTEFKTPSVYRKHRVTCRIQHVLKLRNAATGPGNDAATGAGNDADAGLDTHVQRKTSAPELPGEQGIH